MLPQSTGKLNTTGSSKAIPGHHVILQDDKSNNALIFFSCVKDAMKGEALAAINWNGMHPVSFLVKRMQNLHKQSACYCKTNPHINGFLRCYRRIRPRTKEEKYIEITITCFPRYSRPRPRGRNLVRDSPNSVSLRSIREKMMDWATSSLQEPTNTKPREMAVKATTSSGTFGSLKMGDKRLRI